MVRNLENYNSLINLLFIITLLFQSCVHRWLIIWMFIDKHNLKVVVYLNETSYNVTKMWTFYFNLEGKIHHYMKLRINDIIWVICNNLLLWNSHYAILCRFLICRVLKVKLYQISSSFSIIGVIQQKVEQKLFNKFMEYCLTTPILDNTVTFKFTYWQTLFYDIADFAIL